MTLPPTIFFHFLLLRTFLQNILIWIWACICACFIDGTGKCALMWTISSAFSWISATWGRCCTDLQICSALRVCTSSHDSFPFQPLVDSISSFTDVLLFLLERASGRYFFLCPHLCFYRLYFYCFHYCTRSRGCTALCYCFCFDVSIVLTFHVSPIFVPVFVAFCIMIFIMHSIARVVSFLVRL